MIINPTGIAYEPSLKMPVLFIGHGNPMYAIEENKFTEEWEELGRTMPRPKAILSISAHWETHGTQVTVMENPSTIHDFGGFPQQLSTFQYPSPGSPELAQHIIDTLTLTQVTPNTSWGLDHGTWCILCKMYPEANIPVIQLSLDYTKSALEHYQLAKELESLRNDGVLIIGSGNIIHNLRQVAWDKTDSEEYGHDWAIEAQKTIKQLINENKHTQLINYKSEGKAVQLAIPTPEHFIPLLYILALKEENSTLNFFNDKLVMGSLSMTSIIID